jgi:two-component system response regulator
MTESAEMLVVEDDPDDLALLRRAMRRASVDVAYDVAIDGDEAIAWLERVVAAGSPPRVVLLDLKLPRRSGFDVLAWMKSRDKLRRIPVVIFTSSNVGTDLDRAYDLGANSYLVKPATPSALLLLIAQIDSYWLGVNRTR